MSTPVQLRLLFLRFQIDQMKIFKTIVDPYVTPYMAQKGVWHRFPWIQTIFPQRKKVQSIPFKFIS